MPQGKPQPPREKATHRLSLASRPVAIRAADPGQPNGRRTFEIVAYTGEPLNVWGFDTPVVVDLATADLSAQAVPVLYDHMPYEDCIVGQGQSLAIENGRMVCRGVFTPTGDEHDQSSRVLARADAGYQWQASIGADAAKYERFPEGSTVEVNGRTHAGPVTVASGVMVREVSFTVLGADRRTTAVVARRRIKGSAMNPSFEEWLASLGFKPDGLDETQMANMKLLYQAEYPEAETPAATTDPAAASTGSGDAVTASDGTTPPDPNDPNKVTAKGKKPTPVKATAPTSTAAIMPTVAEIRAGAASELKRITAVQKIAANHPEIAAQAVEQGWTTDKTELMVIRAERPKGNLFITGAGRMDSGSPRMIEAALAQAGKMPDGVLEKHFDARTLQAAHDQFKSRISLHELLLQAAIGSGYVGSPNVKANVRPVLQAAFSNANISGILSNTANKFLLVGFMGVEQTWSMIAAKRNATDFKTMTSYRLNGAFTYEKVGANGVLKHGDVGESSYTNKVDTYGKMFAITRQDIINDDLGALTALPQRIGRGGALKLNDVFWTEFMDNATFFASGNNNYISGGTTNLQSSSLETAEQKFLDQTDPDGKPVGASAAILLVPSTLKRKGMELMQSANFNTGGSSTTDKVPNSNTWQGAYQVAASTYLRNTAFTGYSTTAWYLLANPADLAVIEVAFLNGQETPTVETADADFNTLGIQMRGYHDFGCAKQEYRAGVKSKGAA